MLVFVIIGAFVGAGFASGQEIYLFFYRYGLNGILGLAFCSALIGLIIFKTCSIIKNNDIKNYRDFLSIIFKQNKTIIKFLNVIVNLFLLITFFIMVAGFSAYFAQEIGINKTIVAIFFAISCFFLFMTNMQGIAKVSSYIVPVLIIFVLIISGINFIKLDLNTVLQTINKDNFNNKYLLCESILQSLLYCSYNMILIIPVIVNLKSYIKSRKQIFIVSILTGIIIFILSISIYFLLINGDSSLVFMELPVAYVISNYFSEFKTIYGVIILLSIFTTAISIGISFLTNIVKCQKYFSQVAGILCIASIVVSNFGFSNLVNLLFPIFGYLGLIQIVYILHCK